MTVAEKQAMCCAAYNSANGCRDTTCRVRHWCSAVKDATKRMVCWGKDHNVLTHP